MRSPVERGDETQSARNRKKFELLAHQQIVFLHQHRRIGEGAKAALAIAFDVGPGRAFLSRTPFVYPWRFFAAGDAHFVCAIALSVRCGFFRRGFERQVPFVHHDNHGAAGLVGVARDVGVARGHSQARRPRSAAPRRPVPDAAAPSSRSIFRRRDCLALAANSGRIHKAVGASAVAAPPYPRRRAWCPAYRETMAALRARKPVEQRRFADVGPADNRDVDRNFVARLFGGSFVALLRRLLRDVAVIVIQQIVDTVAMLGGNAEDRHSEARKTARPAIPACCVSTLFAAIASGLPVRRSRRASSASSGVSPARASTTSSSWSRLRSPPAPGAESRAESAALSSGTMPPVSTNSNVRPCQVAVP